MEFCDECGSMMTLEDGVWLCGDCGATAARDDDSEDSYVSTESQDAGEVIEVEEHSELPTTEARCPECGHERAGWYMQQIRAADESETRFFVCQDCGHKWREDDH
jgi:DNA-directed RNA polymerase subunit M